MSSGFDEKRAELLEQLVQELRQFNGAGASFFRAAAARLNMTVTDLQVIDLLNGGSPMTAGQLAILTGLTTGAITGMLTRLEEVGLVRRERDPNDGRKVIVRLAQGQGDTSEAGRVFDALAKGWRDMATGYSEEQIALLLEFVKRSNAVSIREIDRLRETPASDDKVFSAPLGQLERGRLVISSGISKLTLRTDEAMHGLYQARFDGSPPEVTFEVVPQTQDKEGIVTIRYPKRLWKIGDTKRAADVALNPSVPWQILIQGGASEVMAGLGRISLTGLEIKGGMSSVLLELPVPGSLVPILISGGASDVVVRRPVGVAARVHLKGWASHFIFDDQNFSAVGNDLRLQSRDFDATAPGYDIEVASSVSMVTITAG